MDKKTIYLIVLAAIVITIIVFYNDTLTIIEIATSIIALASSLSAVYNWLVRKELNEVIKKSNLNK